LYCYSRYDYEECDSQAAENMMNHVRQVIASSPPGTKFGAFELALADDFEYTDPIDGSVAKKQGLRFIFKDGSRIIFRWVPSYISPAAHNSPDPAHHSPDTDCSNCAWQIQPAPTVYLCSACSQ
jgi:hypothetical protein